jgi:molybdopterin-guanine dinucleotide biosynthesis protein
MRMIPDVLLQTPSNAEAKVFRLLRDVKGDDSWVGYHSLNCSEHAYKHWAEIDFLIVRPDVILILEIKGGRVQCRDGVWTFIDRFDRPHTSTEGPYQQARSAMYALKDLLADRYRLPTIISSRVPFGFGVVFTDVDWAIDTPESPAAITGDRLAVSAPSHFAAYLNRVAEYWKAKQPGVRRLTAPELRDLRNRLRPDVDVYPPLRQRMGDAVAAMQQLTDEQYERLSTIECNDRAVVTGGAGTGKTFLLVQYARRCVASGLTVQVVVHSEVLAAFLAACLPDRAVAVACVESLRLRESGPADVLLVDEGQDLMTVAALERLSSVVRGGIDNGRWCWFMDANNQANVAGHFDPETHDYLLNGLPTGKPIRMVLRRNCRNTREIVRYVQLWTGADIGMTEVSGNGGPPQLLKANEEDVPAVLATSIRKVLDDGARPEDIGLVFEDDDYATKQIVERLSPDIQRYLVQLNPLVVAHELTGRILWGSAKRFKGLERPIVFAIALDAHSVDLEESQFYVAVTRANYALYVVASPERAARISADMERNLTAVSLRGS